MMKIISQDLSQLGAAGAAGAQETQKSGSGRGGARSCGGGDHVSFSSTLGSLSRAMSSDASSRQAKVQALAAQYQAGAYKPDSVAISRGLMSEALSA